MPPKLTPSASAPGNGPSPTADTKNIAQISSETLRSTLRIASADSRTTRRAVQVPSGKDAERQSDHRGDHRSPKRDADGIESRAPEIVQRRPVGRNHPPDIAADHRQRAKQLAAAQFQCIGAPRQKRGAGRQIDNELRPPAERMRRVHGGEVRHAWTNMASRMFKSPGPVAVVYFIFVKSRLSVFAMSLTTL